jgi:pimeloyl-ACP methyl ester carboxylesterase
MDVYRRRVPTPPVPPDKIAKPTAIAHFPGELVFWPKSYAERHFNLVHWTDMPHGGHFAAMEQPKLFSRRRAGVREDTAGRLSALQRPV